MRSLDLLYAAKFNAIWKSNYQHSKFRQVEFLMRWFRFLIASFFILLSGFSANAGFHGGGTSTYWNGSLVQFALGTVSPYPFIDYEKNDGNPFKATAGVNQYGWPASYTAMSGSTGCGVAGTSLSFGTVVPPQSERGPNMTIDWVGCAQLDIDYTITIVSVGQNSCTGSCKPCTQSGNVITGTNCYVTFTTTQSGANSLLLESVGDGTTDPQLTQVREYDSTYASIGRGGNGAIDTCYSGIANNNITQLQSCFNPLYISEGKIAGVMRFVNAMGENLGPNSFQSTWEQNTPLPYRYWTGNVHNIASDYTTNSVTAATGGSCTSITMCFTLADTGFSLTDRATVIANIGSTVTVPTTSPSSNVAATSCSGTPKTCLIPFSSGVPSTVVPGQVIWESGTGGNPLAPTVYVVSVDNVGNTVTIGCQEESNSIGCSPILSGDTVLSTDTMYFSPMLNVNGTGYVPMASTGGNGIIAGASTGHTEIFLYDADLQRYITDLTTGTNDRGIASGWPPAVMVAYTNAIGAHPWYNVPCFAMGAGAGGTRSTDYVSNLVSYNKSNLLPGLKPFYEGTDEIWNASSYSCTNFASTVQYWRTGVTGQYSEWYGEQISNVAQIVSAGYGNPSAINRFNYYRVIDGYSAYGIGCGVGTAFTATCQDARIYYSGDGNQPALYYVTDVAVAPYYSNSNDNTANSGSATDATGGIIALADAYAYYLSPSPSIIASYMDGVNNPSGHNSNLYKNQNSLYPEYATYLAGYTTDSTHGGPYPIRFTNYEGGGNVTNFTPTAQTAPITSIATGATTTLTTTSSNAWYLICAPILSGGYNLCTASGPSYTGNPQVLTSSVCSEMQGSLTASQSGNTLTVTAFSSSAGGILAVGSQITVPGHSTLTVTAGSGTTGTYTATPSQTVTSESMTADDLEYAVVTSAAVNTVVINAATDSGCSYSSGGSAVYAGAGSTSDPAGVGYIGTFQELVWNEDLTPTNFMACELANWESMYATMSSASVTPEFPSVYDQSEGGRFAVGRYWPDMSAAAGPTIYAVQKFNISQTGNATCNP